MYTRLQLPAHCCGVHRHGLAVSLDSWHDEVHDFVRNKPNTFELAMRGIRAMKRAGIPLQINCTAMQYNIHDMDELVELAGDLGSGIMLMYQLVPVGRGEIIKDATLKINENERLLKFLAKKQQDVYIKSNGDAWPCPFVKISAGNVRTRPFDDIWRSSEIFEHLRNRENMLKGKCGECGYRSICGCCRGRSMAYSGDYLSEDPSCFLRTESEIRLTCEMPGPIRAAMP